MVFQEQGSDRSPATMDPTTALTNGPTVDVNKRPKRSTKPPSAWEDFMHYRFHNLSKVLRNELSNCYRIISFTILL